MTRLKHGSVRGGIAISGALALALATLGLGMTQAGFTNEIRGEANMSGAIDIAQSADGEAQHSTVEEAKLLTEGMKMRPILALDDIPVGWPSQSSVSFDAKVYSVAGEGLVNVRARIIDLTDSSETPYPSLLFGFKANGNVVGDGTPISGPWFDDHSEGVVLSERLGTGEELAVNTTVWLRGDAPDGHWAVPITVGLQIIAETTAGETIILEGDWS